MRRVIITLCLLFSAAGWAGSEDTVVVNEKARLIEQQNRSLCYSTKEYIATLKFLHTTRSITYTENASRKIAEKVAKGCDGAADRFSKVLVLLASVGLSEHGALAMALEFAAQPPDVQKNFTEIFSHAFLGEFLDYEYPRAAKLAFELSRDYRGDPVQAREDFLDLIHFCKGNKSLDLPMNICAELTVKFAHLSQYYANGARQPFHLLFDKLRTDKDFSMSIKTALDITYNVLKSGPRASENFLSGFNFATSKEGLSLNQHEAISFALRMADRSFIGEQPPAIPAPTEPAEITHAAKP